MSDYQTVRHALPLLAAGQAHKELFHNEALQRLDFLIDPIVEGLESAPDSLSPSVGQCWLIDLSATGEWQGYDNHVACWTENGWMYLEPVESFRLMRSDQSCLAVYRSGVWRKADTIEMADSGGVVDLEARDAIDSIIMALQMHGILPEQV